MASGGGRTVLNLHDALRASQLDSEVEFQHVFVSRPGVAAVERCRAIGMQVHLPDGAVDAAATAFLHSTDPDMVLLCGYLRWLDIPETLKNRVLNIHPSLLPRHGGKGMHGMHVHGMQVHGMHVHR